MITLYHGSTVKVEKPKIIVGLKKLDFGVGFYTTSDKSQASKWAKLKAQRSGTGSSILNIYEFDETEMDNLKIIRFEKPDRNWLRFVVANRTSLKQSEPYDIVYGPVANDSTITVINSYIQGMVDENTAIALLLPQKLKDQYVFCSEESLKHLKFKEAIVL